MEIGTPTGVRIIYNPPMAFSWFNLLPPKDGSATSSKATSGHAAGNKSGKALASRTATIDIDGEPRQVKIIESTRTSRLTLRLLPGGDGLRMTVPPKTSNREINAFLTRNKAWAAARLSRMPKEQVVEADAVIPFRGEPHRIVATGKTRGLVEIARENDEAILRVPGSEKHMPRRLVDFFKQQARQDLSHAVALHASSLGVKAKSITLRDTKSRWGSCSSNGNLSFSWRIIMAPPEVLDYLAAHEVAHLREMNHSPDFWALVESICPDMARHKSWLRANGASLHAVVV